MHTSGIITRYHEGDGVLLKPEKVIQIKITVDISR